MFRRFLLESVMKKTNDREKKIVRTSVIGILANLVLVTGKALTGLATNSIAIILDAINNLTDALSSLITILGVKLAAKHPDRKHPFGYGRVEYLSSLAVAGLILYAGIESLLASMDKIIHPVTPVYSNVSLFILAMAVAVKLGLSFYVKKVGRDTNSSTLVASGMDAFNDAIISLSVFISALLFMATDLSIEAYVGLVIAIMILKSAFELMRDTLDDILGKSAEKETVRELKAAIRNVDPRIQGAYDLMLHNYGPGHYVGSVHIAIPDTMTANEIDALIRRVNASIYETYGISLTGIGIYSINSENDLVTDMFQKVRSIVMGHDGVIQMHGFYVDTKQKTCSLDIVIAWDEEDREALFNHITNDIETAYPDYDFTVNMDIEI